HRRLGTESSIANQPHHLLRKSEHVHQFERRTVSVGNAGQRAGGRRTEYLQLLVRRAERHWLANGCGRGLRRVVGPALVPAARSERHSLWRTLFAAKSGPHDGTSVAG